jgi:hypothetical protein
VEFEISGLQAGLASASSKSSRSSTVTDRQWQIEVDQMTLSLHHVFLVFQILLQADV